MNCEVCGVKGKMTIGGVIVCESCKGYTKEKPVKIAISSGGKTEISWVERIENVIKRGNNTANKPNRRRNKKLNGKSKDAQSNKARTN